MRIDCPKCEGFTRVLNHKHNSKAANSVGFTDYVGRSRRCDSCGNKFTTIEVEEIELELLAQALADKVRKEVLATFRKEDPRYKDFVASLDEAVRHLDRLRSSF